MTLSIPSVFSRGRLREFFTDGYAVGRDAAKTWTTSEAVHTERDLRKRPILGELFSEWLSSYRQYADTVYDEPNVSERQLEAWEAGAYEGAARIIEPWALARGIELR
jgi:hypothetical protein